MSRCPSILLALCLPLAALAQDQQGDEEEDVQPEATDPEATDVVAEPEAAPETDQGPRPWRTDVDLELSEAVGVMDGEQFLDGFGPVSVTEASLTSRFRRGPWRLRFPVDLSHRQTFGFALAETRARLEGKVGLQGDVFSGDVEAGISGAFRPKWPDPYKVDASGVVQSSNRQSYLAPAVGAGIEVAPHRHHHLDLSYTFKHYNYIDDPTFDPVAEPTHLTPGDQFRHSVDLSWTSRFDDARVEIGTEVDYKSYTQRYGRDAGTGLTHANAGGAPANPLQKTLATETYVQLRYQLGEGPVELRAEYGLEVVVDLFQGYYSYLGHHPTVGVDVEWDSGAEVKLRSELYWRRNGKDGYAEGPSHPPLDFGTRREDHRVKADLEVAVPVSGRLLVIVESDLAWRETNFPDYEPGVFPATAEYDIDWDYTNWMAVAGVRYRL